MAGFNISRVKTYLGRKLLRSTNPLEYSAYPKDSFGTIHLESCINLPTREAMISHFPKGGVVAEIGVNKGEFSTKVLQLTQPNKFHVVDMWSSKRYHSGIQRIVESKFDQEIKQGKMELNLGMSTEVIPTFPDHYFDWVYLDTDHLLDNTRLELELLRTKMKSNGIIAGHDYIIGNWDGVVRYGVIEAVREFCIKHNWKMIYLTHELDVNPSFAITQI